MVNKIKVAPAEPPEEPVGEPYNQEKIIDETPPPEKISTKHKVLYGVGVLTAVFSLVLVITLPIVLKNPPETLEVRGWDDWSEWSRCSATCDQGQRSRMRLCSDGKGGTGNAYDCPGDAVDHELCKLNKCLSGRAMVKSTCTDLRQSLNITDNLFCDRYAQSVTLNGEVINSPDAVEKGYGVWRLTEKEFKRILGYYYFQMVKAACGEIPEFSSSNILNQTLNFVNEEPCLSAVAWLAYLKIENLLPIPIVFGEQEKILQDTTNHILMDWDSTLTVEKKEMQDTCRLADIDFDFVIDQSGSVGYTEWNNTMHNIANYWIDVIQPNGAKTCGNHVAARKFSDKHKRWHDFQPPSKSKYSSFSNYTEYVKSVFKNESYDGGATHTAEALRRVRLEDLPRTRHGQTFVMIFTDGYSNDPIYGANLEEEAKLLQNNVDNVYAYGIKPENVNPDELEIIASNNESWYIMDNFERYNETINMFILQQGGCATEFPKPFRKSFKIICPTGESNLKVDSSLNFDIFIRIPDILNETYGLSDLTVMENHPKEDCLRLFPNMSCPNHPETARTPECIKCSWFKAAMDLSRINEYKANIIQVADEKCFPASIIAAFISRETRGGVEHLDKIWKGVPGWGLCQNIRYRLDDGRDELCYGIMHLREEFGENNTNVPFTDEGIGSLPYLRQGVDEIIRLIDFMADRWSLWDEHLQVRAGIAAWDISVEEVWNHAAIDIDTKNQDFSSDIFARAQFFAASGYS